MVTAKDINDGRILYEQARRTSRSAFIEKLTDKSRPNIGDVLVTKDGTLGRIAIVDRPDVCVNQSVAVLQPNSSIRPTFLKLVLEEPRNHQRMLSEAEGSTIKHIYVTRLAKQPVRVPPLTVQDLVLSIISPLERKIELNRKMNATLESMARALFRDWFVDFGPTRATMEGREPYLSPDLWSLFPDRLDDEGKPAGWEMGTLGDLVSFNPKEALKRGTAAPYLDMASLPTQGASHDEPIQRDMNSGSKFKDGDTLLARITPCLENGKTCLVNGLGNETVGWGSTEFIVMRPRPPLPQAFAYLVARDPDFRQVAIKSMTGTSGRQRATVNALAEYPFVLAPAGLVKAFGDVMDDLFSGIAHNERESRTLARTRDLLLPRLMSGELRVAQVERLVSEVA